MKAIAFLIAYVLTVYPAAVFVQYMSMTWIPETFDQALIRAIRISAAITFVIGWVSVVISLWLYIIYN